MSVEMSKRVNEGSNPEFPTSQRDSEGHMMVWFYSCTRTWTGPRQLTRRTYVTEQTRTGWL